MRNSNKPFPETINRLIDEQDVSGRELARRTQHRDGWGDPSSISVLRRGTLRPSLGAMESIAGALGVAPEVFAEYRLGKAREALDPDKVGLKRALANLKKTSL